MKNLKGDILWGALLVAWIMILVVPETRTVFIEVTEKHPYVGGFVKFSILASMGDLLGGRILKGKWIMGEGFIWKACNWGILGVMITLIFSVFVAGTIAAQASGKLPFKGITFALALFASVLMNMTFGPMLYIYHKFGDLLIDLLYERKKGIVKEISINEMVRRVDWYSMVSFSWLKTCTLVWMPCHTMVFLLPEQYRVLASAFLSILLGIIVAIAKKNKNSVQEQVQVA